MKRTIPSAHANALVKTRSPPILATPVVRFSAKSSSIPKKPNDKAEAFFHEKDSFKRKIASPATKIGMSVIKYRSFSYTYVLDSDIETRKFDGSQTAKENCDAKSPMANCSGF